MTKSYNLKNNVIEEYLKENCGKNLSLKTIYRDLKLKRRKAIWLLIKVPDAPPTNGGVM